MSQDSLIGEWKPCSWREQLAGLVWLPRLIDKAQRIIDSERSGSDLMGSYMYGDHDYLDGLLLKFLHTDGKSILEQMRNEPDHKAVADTLVQRSGRTPEECAAWNKRFSRLQGLFLAMLEADEGRRQPGLLTWILRVSYNILIVPPATWAYHRALRKEVQIS